MDTVTLAITLPVNGTPHDYVAAIHQGISANPNALAQAALSGLLTCIHTARPETYVEGRTTLVYGKMS